MTPIKFPGHNVVFAEDQPEYQSLPALRLPDGTVISCWKFTEQEKEDIVKNGFIFLQQSTFNQPLQPILPMANLEDGLSLI